MKLTRFFVTAGFCLALQIACAADARTVFSLNGVWEIAEGGMEPPPPKFDHRTPALHLAPEAQSGKELRGSRTSQC